MRLSEAIRLGSMLAPKLIGDLTGERKDGQIGTCALGAAYMAINCKGEPAIAEGDVLGFRGSLIRKGQTVTLYVTPWWWRKLLDREVVCPMCGQRDFLKRVVAHLNDSHLWSRELIADWVEKQEPKKKRIKDSSDRVLDSATR